MPLCNTRHAFMMINYMYGYIFVDVETGRGMILQNSLAEVRRADRV